MLEIALRLEPYALCLTDVEAAFPDLSLSKVSRDLAI
jgi:hypothetical protein